ncbi:MAG: DNA internalization-related competence protein ComEC/Rec2 [Candidatus Marinimicrobia bacterium]|nr:DNA internalization-related competence protein ComEC/Rec2 [Candidatus Neomarinimicrobiota bacterium]
MLEKIHHESPMVLYFFCLSAGIIGSQILPLPILTIAVVTLLAGTLAILLQKFDISKYIVFLSIGLLGMFATSLYNFQSRDHLARFDFPSEQYSIEGIVTSRRIFPDRQKIVLSQIRVGGRSFDGKILTTISNPQKQFFNGDTLEYIGSLYSPDGSRNPGEFDYRNYLFKQKIFMLSQADKKAAYRVRVCQKLNLKNLADRLKAQIMANIDQSISGEPAHILKALIVGARDELEGETTEIFVYSGTIHILAVSGLHVAYVTLSLLVIFSFLRLSDRQRTVLTIIGLFFYIIIVDFKPSVIRAVIMAAIILIGKSWERKVNVYNSLAAAGFIQLLISPMQLFDAGFQLSFSAVFSIVYFHNRIKFLLPQKFHPGQIKNSLLRNLYQLLLVSFAALIGTLPITAYYFNRIAPVGLLANLFAIPLIGLVGAAGFSQVILGFFIPSVNLFYGQVNQLLIEVLIRLTHWSAAIPFGSVNVPEINLLHVALFYLFIFGLFNLEKRQVKFTLGFAVLLMLNLQIWLALFAKPQLEVVFFDVGQGDAALVKFPTGEKMLIDTGDRTFSRNYAETVLLPYFLRQNIRHIEIMNLTHPHSDHIGGAPLLLKNLSIGEIWEPEVTAQSKTYSQIHFLADSLAIPVKKIYAGDYFSIGGCDLFVLHPSRKYLATKPENFNHYSTAIKLAYKDFDIFFSGDIEKEDEAYISLYDQFIDCEILKVPHHGSNTSSTENFIKKVSPEIAFVSVGRNNKFKHPSSKILQRYSDQKALVHRSDLLHSLSLISNGIDYQIKTR